MRINNLIDEVLALDAEWDDPNLHPDRAPRVEAKLMLSAAKLARACRELLECSDKSYAIRQIERMLEENK